MNFFLKVQYKFRASSWTPVRLSEYTFGFTSYQLCLSGLLNVQFCFLLQKSADRIETPKTQISQVPSLFQHVVASGFKKRSRKQECYQ